MTNYKALRALCDAATDEREKLNIQAIADFIAATDPQTVRALIDEVEKYRAALDTVVNLAIRSSHDTEYYIPAGAYVKAQQALKGTGHE